MYKHGLTLGKFMPLHKGHELLIHTAANNCQKLTIQISRFPNDENFVARYTVLENFVQTYYPDAKIVVLDDEFYQTAATDSDGTVLDNDYWEWYIEQTKKDIDLVDAVFTSDRYGERLAEELNAEWVPVDPGREIIPISATQIRGNIYDKWDYLSDHTKEAYTKSIAIIGPESTGKSTLVKNLAEKYQTSFANEYGRTLFEMRQGYLTTDDYETIAITQDTFIHVARMNARNGIFFIDTEALVTNAFSKFYFGVEMEFVEDIFKDQLQNIDLYLVLAPTVPLVDDGWRETGQEDREEFFRYMIEKLEENNLNYRVIDQETFEERTACAIDIIEEMRNNPTVAKGFY